MVLVSVERIEGASRPIFGYVILGCIPSYRSALFKREQSLMNSCSPFSKAATTSILVMYPFIQPPMDKGPHSRMKGYDWVSVCEVDIFNISPQQAIRPERPTPNRFGKVAF